MEHSGNISIFSIPETFPGNIPRNFIGNFFRIFWEYIMGMFHEYSTNIYLPGVWIAVYVKSDNAAYFDSFGVEYIPKERKTSQASKI